MATAHSMVAYRGRGVRTAHARSTTLQRMLDNCRRKCMTTEHQCVTELKDCMELNLVNYAVACLTAC
eukprot:5189739-Heterocapsa_arctica.AAC.1